MRRADEMLEVELGDKIVRRGACLEPWTVAGINTINGDVYAQHDCGIYFNTVTASTAHQWSKVV
jgi:hypothetical protein